MTGRSRTGTAITQSQRLRMTQALTAAIRILRFDSSGLTRYLEEQAAENPALRLSAPAVEPGDWLPRWSGVWSSGAAPLTEEVAAAGPSLMAHVADEIGRLFPQAERRQALVFAQALEPSGWLGRPLPALAAEAGLSLPAAERMLARLQDAEPTGLFARSLRECLELQAREAGLLDGPMQAVLAQLDRVAAGDLAGIARRAGVTEAEVAQALRRLRGFDPKPGTQFDPGAAPVREPDLVVRREAGAWRLSLNRGALPSVAVSPGAGDVAAARGVVRLIEARGRMLLAVATEALRRQERVLDEGPSALVPMTMGEVAAALGLHVSTVSRAVAGTSLDAPGGTIWLRALFSQAVGEAVASGALRARLAALVAGEDPAAPMTDAALAEALGQAAGCPVARRTVAKYRAAGGIPPAHRRRRRPA